MCKQCTFLEQILLYYDRKIQINDANLVSTIIVSKIQDWN